MPLPDVRPQGLCAVYGHTQTWPPIRDRPAFLFNTHNGFYSVTMTWPGDHVHSFSAFDLAIGSC